MQVRTNSYFFEQKYTPNESYKRKRRRGLNSYNQCPRRESIHCMRNDEEQNDAIMTTLLKAQD